MNGNSDLCGLTYLRKICSKEHGVNQDGVRDAVSCAASGEGLLGLQQCKSAEVSCQVTVFTAAAMVRKLPGQGEGPPTI